jgi:hypothetical protein
LLQVPCLITLLRQEDLVFLKAIYNMQSSPAILKLRTALASSKNKRKTLGSAGSRGTTLRPPGLNAGKRKANELVNLGGLTEPANRCPEPGAGSAPLPAFIPVTGEQAALGSRQLGPPEGGVTYTAPVVGPVAPSHPSGSLKPTAIESYLSETAVSSESSNRRTYSDMSGHLGDMPDDTTFNAQVNNTCVPSEVRPNKTPILNSGVRDTRAFLARFRASCPGGLTAQLKSEKLMVVPSRADGFRAAVSALRSLDGGGCEFPHLHAPGGPLCAVSGEEPG